MAPKLEAQHTLAADVALLEPLKELAAVEGGDMTLAPEFRAIVGSLHETARVGGGGVPLGRR